MSYFFIAGNYFYSNFYGCDFVFFFFLDGVSKLNQR